MGYRVIVCLVVLLNLIGPSLTFAAEPALDLAGLKKKQRIYDFLVANLYSDSDRRIVGVKFWHVPSGAPVYLLQIETVPQAYMWIETPVDSARGLPHALEHLLTDKGTKGKYLNLLTNMRLSQYTAASWRDFNLYSFSSGSGMDGFFELLRAELDALYYPDFTDAEAEREFYHFGVVTDPATKTRTLTEGGTVYNEMVVRGEDRCFFDLYQRVMGKENPLGENIGGDPDEMRNVTARDIRAFHKLHYRLGPTTGFIFAIHPKENAAAFLQKVSNELALLPRDAAASTERQSEPVNPKYPIHPSEDIGPHICSIPGANEAAPAEVWFAWKPETVRATVDMKLAQLLFRALADGERSLLYKSLIDSKTRETDTGATSVSLDPNRSESPRFVLWQIGILGIPGNQMSVDKIAQLRNAILAKIRAISEYQDHSLALTGFNKLVSSYAQDSRRSKRIWELNSPLFGTSTDANWKDFLEYLEMDPSFVQSLSEGDLWAQISTELKSGRNIWRELIKKFKFLDSPYASGMASSRQLLQKLESEKQERITNKIRLLHERYHVSTDEEALRRFDQDELAKTQEIDEVAARVPRPHFTEHPPLTADDDIRYSQFQIRGVPTTAVIFERPPTLELGLSFDLRQIPRKYYRYLPILARCFDSLGLKERNHVTPYPELFSETQGRFVEFAAATSASEASHRADLTFRAAVTSVGELRDALHWIDRELESSYLEISNVGRLRDIVAQQLSADDVYTKQDEFSWVFTPALAFRYQGNALYLALDSQFTRAHWDGGLYWLLHEPVSAQDIERLGVFAKQTLSATVSASRADLAAKFGTMHVKGLEAELVNHWKRNLNSFPEERLVDGLLQLAAEVQEDLQTGPAKAISDLKELQRLVKDRRALYLDLLVNPSALKEIRPDLERFVSGVPYGDVPREDDSAETEKFDNPIINKLVQENKLADPEFPWYLGLVVPEEITGNAIFYGDFVKYSQLDRESLLRQLSSGILSGDGPNSLYMKSRDAGLAYALLMRSNLARGSIGYYADRSLDLPSLVVAMNSGAAEIADIHDPYVVDYALRQSFSIPRSVYTFSIRERALAQDIRDGNTPDKMRRFSEALLKLRQEPDLLSEITRAGRDSLCGILLEEACQAQQKADHSIFFFVGSEKILSDAEKRLPVPKLLRIWPSDYWLQ